MRNSICLILLVVTNFCFCQNYLHLISDNNKKNILFKIGDRIGYTEKGFSINQSGVIQEIQDKVIIANNKTIKIEDIKFIGFKKKGTNFYVIASSALAGAALGYFTLPKDNSSLEKIVGMSISIPLFSFGHIISRKNRLYKIKDKYKLEVTSLSDGS